MGQYYSPDTHRDTNSTNIKHTVQTLTDLQNFNLRNFRLILYYTKGFFKIEIMTFVFKLVSNFSLRD